MGIVYLTTNIINGKQYIGVDSKNNDNYYGSGKAIKLALKKYGTNNFTKEILEENEDINYLFEREKYYITKYNAIESPNFYNLAEGGKGGAGTLITEESKEKHKLGSLKAGQITIEKRKGKTYKDIYGDKADEEKEKRRVAGLGKKYSYERVKKVSCALKGRDVWNKGLTIDDDRVSKNIKNRKQRKFIKTYILIFSENEELIFNGKKELEKYIKNINNTLNLKNRINIDNLIKNKFDKNYKLLIS
jgi:hypothetical protein